MNNALIPFRFQGVRLKEACWIEGKPYFTRRSIGEWLGYVKPRPDIAIAKIIERNPHIRQFAVVTKLVTTDGKEYEMEVYDPIGLQLIVNKSNQPKALAFQIAVAHMVVAYMRGELVPVACFEGLEGILGIPRGKGINAAVERLAEERRCSRQTIYKQLSRLRAGKPIYKERKKGYVQKKYADKFIEFQRLKDSGMNGIELSKELGMPQSTVYLWRQRGKNE